MGIIHIMASLLFLMSIGIPVAYSLLLTSFFYLVADGNIPLSILTQRLAAGPDSFPLLAVPFFVFAGLLMNTGGITKRIFKFAETLVGHIPGSMGHVNVIASVIFSGMSGAASADAGGLGLIEIEAMRKAGYDDDFSVGITAASSIIGPIIPPSVPAVIYGAMAGVSVGGLFIGGIIPGILMAFSLTVLVYIIAIKRNYPRLAKRSTFKEIFISFIQAVPALLTPMIIIGGIWTGVFTPTESASVAVLYAIILGLFFYKELTIGKIWNLMLESAGMAARGMIIVAGAVSFGYILSREQVALKLSNFLFGITENPYGLMLLIILFLFIIGTFMEPVTGMIILIPVFNPIIRMVGYHPIHFGIVMIITMMLGLLTPPVGGVLNILSAVSGIPFEVVAKSVFIFLIPLITVVIAIVFFPEIVLFLPRLMLGIG
jgi:tripartite ATP-independent transporter DctM subunit